jgi:hypothetical protein
LAAFKSTGQGAFGHIAQLSHRGADQNVPIHLEQRGGREDAMANEIGHKRGVMNEVFRQLLQVYPDLPQPDYQFLTQSAYDADQRRWVPFNHAFMTTTHGHVPNRSVLYENLYNCGVQNGNSSYSFTSMESSVANAIHLATTLQPELGHLNVTKVREAVTVRSSVAIIATVTLVAVIALNHFRKTKLDAK